MIPATRTFRVRDVSPPAGLEVARVDDRKALRAQVDRFRRLADRASGDPAMALDEYYEQGYDLMSSPTAQKAFDIHGEPDAVRDAYGRTPFGQRCLLARRLVEAGVPFITLNEGGWDHHETLFDAYDKRMPPWESSLAALIEDLDRRGMLASTLVIALGEFGRTPKVNDKGGRDHWSNAMSALFAGGGNARGSGHRRDRLSEGYAAIDRILSPENFAATVYTKLGIDPATILHAPTGRPVHLVSDPTPIRELMG